MLSGYTFSNVSGSGLTGTMPNIKAIDDAISSVYVENGSSGTGIYTRMNAGAHITEATSGYPELFIPQSQIVNAIGLTADKIVSGNTILGLVGTAIKAYTTLSALFQHYYTQNQNKTYTATKDCTVLAICLQTTHGGDGSGGYKSTLTTTGEILSSNKYRKGGYMDGTYRAVDMDTALIKLTNGNNIKMVTPACGNACTIMQVFELS